MSTRFLVHFLVAALTACQTSQPLQTELPLVKQMSVNGTNLAYVDEGQGEVVLFIHGANGDWRTWDELRPFIATRHRFISISRRYHQPNQWPGDGKDYSVRLHVNDVVAFISALGVGKVHLVGGSYGGIVALYVALQRPDLLRSVTASEAWIISDNTPTAKEAIASWREAVHQMSDAIERGDETKASVLLWNAVNDDRFSFDQAPAPRQQRWLANAKTWPLVLNGASPPAVTCAQLGDLRVPALILQSEYARPPFLQANKRLLECLPPGTNTALVPGAPHIWYSVNPRAGADAILAFVAAHE
jgi:pimeloyl-ACP methyl ester carboxylesterase